MARRTMLLRFARLWLSSSLQLAPLDHLRRICALGLANLINSFTIN
jgi:hypothetical protein